MHPRRTPLFIALLMLSCACIAHNAAPAAQAPAAAASRNDPLADLLVQRSFAQVEAMFDENLRSKVPSEKLEAVWSSATKAGGTYRGIQETRSFQADAGRVEVSLLRFEHNLVELRVRWGKDARIGAIMLRPGAVRARALAIARAVLAGDASGVYSHFDSRMKAALSSDKLEEILAGVRAQLGANPAIQDIHVETQRFDVATVQCSGKSAGFDLRLTFRKDTDQLAGLFFLPPNAAARPDEAPPSYADPTRYEERSVEVGDNGRGLPATLTLPRAAGPVPAVVLVHGSGPQDRDETTLANKPFRDLALGLASRGIAVLRYEKRTFGKNVTTLRDPATITFDEETVDDAVSAARLLLAVAGVDPTRVIVVGHSQGAMAAPRIAQREPRVRALVLLAPPARPMEDLLLDQNRYLASLDHSNEAATRDALAALEKQIARVKSSELAAAKSQDLPLGIPASWWLSLRGYAPVELAKQAKKPTLLLLGDRDFQVTAPDLELWKAALGAEPWATIRLLPGLNHLFETGEGTPSPAEYARPGHVSETAITQIAEWILALPPAAASAPQP